MYKDSLLSFMQRKYIYTSYELKAQGQKFCTILRTDFYSCLSFMGTDYSSFPWALPLEINEVGSGGEVA